MIFGEKSGERRVQTGWDRGLRALQGKSPGLCGQKLWEGAGLSKQQKEASAEKQKREASVVFKQQLLFFPEKNCLVRLPQWTFLSDKKAFCPLATEMSRTKARGAYP